MDPDLFEPIEGYPPDRSEQEEYARALLDSRRVLEKNLTSVSAAYGGMAETFRDYAQIFKAMNEAVNK